MNGETVTIATESLTGLLLDWAVARTDQLHGDEPDKATMFVVYRQKGEQFAILTDDLDSVDGHLIKVSAGLASRGSVSFVHLIDKWRVSISAPGPMGGPKDKLWSAYIDTGSFGGRSWFGDTAPVAACRAIVGVHMGEHVEIPKKLVDFYEREKSTS